MWIAGLLANYVVPALALVLIVCRRQHLVILFFSAICTWLLFTALFGILMIPFQKLQVSQLITVFGFILVQELARKFLIFGYSKTEGPFAVTKTNYVTYPLSDLSSAIASGAGFAVVSNLFIFHSMTESALEEGAFYGTSCTQLPVLVFAYSLSFGYSILHILLMILEFERLRNPTALKNMQQLLFHLVFLLVVCLQTYFISNSI